MGCVKDWLGRNTHETVCRGKRDLVTGAGHLGLRPIRTFRTGKGLTFQIDVKCWLQALDSDLLHLFY